MPVPAGTLTVLLTDIEGSTRLWEENPVAMRAAMDRHHGITDEAIRRRGGYRPPDQGEGDSVFAVFARATDAVACALDLQRALLTEAWPDGLELRDRIGLHSGELELREDGRNYYGIPINRCARLRGAAHGGQTVLSQATASLVAMELPREAGLRDLGLHRFKDLSASERVFQLMHAELPDEFPPLRSLDIRPHNLPIQLTRFIGRESEMAEVERMIGTARLLTLTGPGGSGKTRLALQAAADLLEAFREGVWLVELARTSDPALVPRVVSSVLHVREQQGRPIVDTLIDHIGLKKLLLVIDNCEHLIAACAELVETLLSACSNLSILSTSREPLGIPGEVVLRVPALTTPAMGATTAQAVKRFESVELFVDRARSTHPSFVLSDSNASAVAAICERLDGIPLAVELAAARVQAITVDQISERLHDRFRLLTAGSRTALARHQTLRAAVDWSHDLLSDRERVLLRRLAVFAGGFTLDAAESVCGVEPIESEEVLDLLSNLVSKSLVQLEAGSMEGRYRLLGTIREYALEKLGAAREADSFRDLHLDWCIRFAEEGEPELRGPEQQAWLDRLHTELDNFRAAFGWGAAQEDPQRALRLGSSLLEFWIVRADWGEGRQWLEAALGLPGEVDPAVRMKALRAAGELADVLSDYPSATAHFESSLAMARELDDGRAIAAALIGLAHEAERTGRFRSARPLLEEAVSILRSAGDEPSMARSLGGLAWLEDNYRVARSLWEENLSIRRRLGNQEMVAWSVLQVGLSAQGMGDYEAARTAYRESLEIGKGLGYKRLIARSLTQLGELSRSEARLEEARALFEETLPTWREIGHKSGLLDSLRGLGDVALMEGDPAGARPLLEESLAVCREIGARVGAAAALQSLATVALVAKDIERAKEFYREALGVWNELEDIHGITGCCWRLADMSAEEGKLELAARLLGVDEALRQRTVAVVSPCDRDGYDRVTRAVRGGLGDARFEAFKAAGAALTLEQATAAALEGLGA